VARVAMSAMPSDLPVCRAAAASRSLAPAFLARARNLRMGSTLWVRASCMREGLAAPNRL